MAEVADQTPAAAYTETDLVAAVRQALQGSAEPLTLSKIRSSLPTAFRSVSLETLEETLNRQVSANVLHQFPKYRSQQNRYWDRPMRDHVIQLLRGTLEEKPLGLAELRRKLPDYAKTQAEGVLEEQVAQGGLHRHPPANARGGPRFGVRRPDPKEYLRAELSAAFGRLEELGFRPNELREGALELLHEEEWGSSHARPAAGEETAEKPAAAHEAGSASAPSHAEAGARTEHQHAEPRHQHAEPKHEPQQHAEPRHEPRPQGEHRPHEPQHAQPAHGHHQS